MHGCMCTPVPTRCSRAAKTQQTIQNVVTSNVLNLSHVCHVSQCRVTAATNATTATTPYHSPSRTHTRTTTHTHSYQWAAAVNMAIVTTTMHTTYQLTHAAACPDAAVMTPHPINSSATSANPSSMR